MNQIFKFLFFFMVYSVSNYGILSQWEHIATIGNNELRAVKFFDAYTGIIAGEGGIWRSTNSGLNWQQVLNGVNLNDLSFFDINNGYSVGDSGKIYRTFNNGLNWEQTGNGITINNLLGVCFSSLIRCNIVGNSGIVLRSSNGVDWSVQNLAGGRNLSKIIMNIEGNGFFVGGTTDEIVYRTINGGTNWATVLNMAGGNYCSDISFLNNAVTLTVIGNIGRIMKTTNAGINWSLMNSGVTEDLNSVTFITGSTGYITGNNGTILKTTSSGANWTSQVSFTTNDLLDVSFINLQTGWIVGKNGTVLRTGIPLSINQNGISANTFKLYQNYPNPFNPTTKIYFGLVRYEYIRVRVYDAQGELVMELVKGYMNSGDHVIGFNGANLPSGIYFCEVTAGSFRSQIKMLLLK